MLSTGGSAENRSRKGDTPGITADSSMVQICAVVALTAQPRQMGQYVQRRERVAQDRGGDLPRVGTVFPVPQRNEVDRGLP